MGWWGESMFFFGRTLGKHDGKTTLFVYVFLGGTPLFQTNLFVEKNNRVKLDDLSHSDEFSAWVQ